MKNQITDVRTLKDMMISAVRYAIDRHTYIVTETIDFVKNNAFLIDNRIKTVLMKDLEWYFEGQKKMDIDYNEWACFYDWLKTFELSDDEISIVSVWTPNCGGSRSGVITTASTYKNCVGISTNGGRY